MRHELLKKLSLSLFLIRANKVKLITAKTISVKLVTGSPMVRPATVMISISKVWSRCFCQSAVLHCDCNDKKTWAKLRFLCIHICDFASNRPDFSDQKQGNLTMTAAYFWAEIQLEMMFMAFSLKVSSMVPYSIGEPFTEY